MVSSGKKLPPAPIIFGTKEWTEEVDRFDPKADARLRAESARREIEARKERPTWKPCEAAGGRGTRLPGCRKVYIPLAQEGASAAPYGFVFQLAKTEEGLVWNFIAFGERHPGNAQTRSVYERAHKRLHGRYPNQGDASQRE
jgi:hypothetical protein